MARVLMIDNYDSFTFNLVQYMQTLGAEVLTHRNDGLSAEEAEGLGATHVVVSPGPGRPEDAGRSMELLSHFIGRVPVLGVCLGHQAIAALYGAPVRHARRLMHGKSSMIEHDGRGVYAGLSNPCEVGRYHSLAVLEEDLHADFEVSARVVGDGELMGFRHRTLPVEGVQFHPESVLTPEGFSMMANFLGVTRGAVSFSVMGGAGEAEARA
ncbi:MAG: anthranilate synthase component II [Phycisphaerales bacterium]